MVHGGQALAVLDDGRKVLIWGALPEESVEIELTKSRKDYAEARVIDIIKPSSERVEPLEENYLATSPWQIMTFKAEANYKSQILADTFKRQKIELPNYDFINQPPEFGYRNKMEYSFYGDGQGLHLALFNRGSHTKAIVAGSALAMPAVDKTANQILSWLNGLNVRASQLKSVIVRASQTGETLAALFVKDQEFPLLDELGELSGFEVYHSNPKSPASVATKLIYKSGASLISDKLLGQPISYGVRSFFQVNLPVFELTLKTIAMHTGGGNKLVDMYAGVGAIGLSVGAKNTTLVELDKDNALLAEQNSSDRAVVINSGAEKTLEYITDDALIIFDPPRAGLHSKIIDRLLQARPSKLIYLSCNPVTQARDLALLGGLYRLKFFEGYNFFPRTPHIESLAVLGRK